MRYWLLVVGASLLGGCHIGSPGSTPAPDAPPPRATVALSDIINNIKCDMLAFEADNPYLTTLGRSLGGTITVTIDRAHTSSGGIAIGIPIAAAGKLSAGISSRSNRDFGETLTIPFVMTYDEGGARANCPDFSNAAAKPPIKGVSAAGTPQTYHLNGPLLNLVELRHQIEAVYLGNPKIGFVGFNFDGTIVLAQDTGGSLGINVYFINPSVAASISNSYKISYHIGTNWRAILKDGRYLDDAASGTPQPVFEMATPVMATPVMAMPPVVHMSPPPAARHRSSRSYGASRSRSEATDPAPETPPPPPPPPPMPQPQPQSHPVDSNLDEAGAAAFIRALERARPATPPQ